MTTTPTALCVNQTRPHTRQAAPGLAICHPCYNTLHHHLTDLPRLWDQLHDLDTTRQAGGGRRGPASSPPVRVDVLALTDPRSQPDPSLPPVAAYLHDWADYLADHRHYTLPITAHAQIALLARNIDWLANQADTISDFTREITDAYHALKRIAGETRHAVATCQQPHPDPQNDDDCGGPIIWTGRNTGTIAICTRCGDTWTDTVVDLHWQQQALRHQRGTVDAS